MSDPIPDMSVLRQVMPHGVIERNAMMTALAYRSVLAFLDRDAQALAAAVERVATWDDYPRAFPYPARLPRFKMAAQMAMEYAITGLRAASSQSGISPGEAELKSAAAALVAELGPAEHQEAAMKVLAAGAGRTPAEEKASLGGLVAYAATAAAVYGDPKIYRSQHTVRRMLVAHIREAEAEAYQVPAAERITEVSEAEARAFLDAIFEDGYPLGEPGELTLPELDILALAQRHLLHTKADASTPEQIAELKRCIAVILKASIDAFSAARPAAYTAPGASFPGSARVQPKRKKPKSKR
jgi:hypothetical protein